MKTWNVPLLILGLAASCAGLSGNRPAKPGLDPVPAAELLQAQLALDRETAPWIRDGAAEATDLLLDEMKHTVRTLDEEWQVAWDAGVPEMT